MTPNTLEIRGLQVALRSGRSVAQVLDGLDLDVGPGEVVGLIGESGSGKTTLINAILGILPNNAQVVGGRIAVAGEERPARGPARNVAYVPQDPSSALDPLFTIGTQIDDVLRARRPDLRDRNRRTALAVATLRAVHLQEPERLLRRRPHQLSGGQRQRLLIGMALMTGAALIVADEPTTALDLIIQAQVLKLLRTIVDERRVAVLVTTHDAGVAHELCDRVAVMYAGRIVESAPTQLLLREPGHPYTRRLLAARGGPAIAPLSGPAPTPFTRPGGCPFHTRCPERLDPCATETPPLRRRMDGYVQCWQGADA